MGWKLINETTGVPIEIGSVVTTFRGETAKLIALSPPRRPGSSGRVTVASAEWLGEREFFPGVIGAKFVTEGK